jgi:sec-independent protein translocase protein TatA
MELLIFNLGPTELIIILVIVLLLFGGSRLAGLGKSSGRALKEFKEETKGLRENKDEPAQGQLPPAASGQYQQPHTDQSSQPVYPPQSGGYQQPQNGYQGQQQPYPPAGYPQQGGAEQPAERDLRRDV